MFLVSESLESSISMSCLRRSAMSLEVRFEFRPESKHGKTKNLIPPSLCYFTKVVGETDSTSYSSYSYSFKKYILLSSLLCKINIPPCGIKLNSFKICMQKCVNITYTIIYLDHLLGLCYQHQVINLIIFCKVRILLPYRFTWVN